MAPWVTSPRREALVVGLLVVVALALRLPTAGAQSFWLDEVYSARIVDGSLGHAWSTIQQTENTPPLFYLLDWLWTRVFGVSELGLRSFSAVVGALAVVPTVRLGRRLAEGGGSGGSGADDTGRDTGGLEAAATGRDTGGVGAAATERDTGGVGAAATERDSGGLAAAAEVALCPGRAGKAQPRRVAAGGSRAAAVGVALTAGLLLVVNPLAQWFSQEARSYALLVLLGAVAWAALVAALDEPTPRRLWGWAVAAVLVTWTHYFGGLLLVVGWGALVVVALRGPTLGFGSPAGGASAVRGRTLDALRPLAGPLLASVVGVAVLLPIAIKQQSTAMYEAISNVKGLGARILETPKQFAVGYNGPLEYVLGVVVAAIALGLILVAAWPRDRRPTRATGLLVLVGLIWVLPLVGVAAGFDVFLTRNLVVLLPPLAVLVALGGWRLGRRGLWLIAVVVVAQLATIVAVAVAPVYQRDDWRGALEAAEGPGPELLLISHYQRPAATWYAPTLRETPPSQVQNVRTLAIIDRPSDAGEPGPPAVPAPPLPIPQMRLVRTVRTDQYRVFVWESPTPVGVPPAVALALLGRNDRATVLRP